MIFKRFDELYISAVLTFVKSPTQEYNDEALLKRLGAPKINKLDTKEDILSDDIWPKVCIMDVDGWICILDDYYGLYNINVLHLESILPSLSNDFGEVLLVGYFNEASEAFILQYCKDGKSVREIDYETEHRPNQINIKEYGSGKQLNELPSILNFNEIELYIKEVMSNFGITIESDISKGRFYSIG